jgi:hypothetical protein
MDEPNATAEVMLDEDGEILTNSNGEDSEDDENDEAPTSVRAIMSL